MSLKQQSEERGLEESRLPAVTTTSPPPVANTAGGPGSTQYTVTGSLPGTASTGPTERSHAQEMEAYAARERIALLEFEKTKGELALSVARSARAEPLGMYCVLAGFFDQDGTRATVQHYGDNTGSEAITNKGYSCKDSQVVMELLHRELPGIEVRSKWAEGASLPADAISRQRPLSP